MVRLPALRDAENLSLRVRPAVLDATLRTEKTTNEALTELNRSQPASQSGLTLALCNKPGLRWHLHFHQDGATRRDLARFGFARRDSYREGSGSIAVAHPPEPSQRRTLLPAESHCGAPPRLLTKVNPMPSSATRKKFIKKAAQTARGERAIQKRIDRLDNEAPPEKPQPMQAGAREYPVHFPEQHLDKPGLEADLQLAPMYDAPDYKGSEKLHRQGGAHHRRRFRHRSGGRGAVRARRRRCRHRVSRRA